MACRSSCVLAMRCPDERRTWLALSISTSTVKVPSDKIKEFTVGPITQSNRNRLLWRDPSVDGIKTGHTGAAGYCLMASAQRGDQRLISVVMGSTSDDQRTNDSQALLNWGFRFYETHQLFAAGKQVAVQKVWKGAEDQVRLGLSAPLLVTLPRGRYAQLKPVMDVPKPPRPARPI